jgi:hypothetical protein
MFRTLPLALALLASPTLAQSWDQVLDEGTSQGGLASGVAASATVIAYGQPRHDPYSKPDIFDAVQVYELQGGAFVHVVELTSSEAVETNASFGRALAMDGDLLAVGDPSAPGAGFVSGIVHLYRRGPSGWQLEQKVRPINFQTSALEFGATLALADDRLVVGAPSSSSSTTIEDGAVFVYEHTAGNWAEVQRLDNPGATLFSQFGRDLDMEGERLLVGTPGAAPDGIAYLFEHQSGSFVQIDSLQPAQPGVSPGFGARVALSGSAAAVSSSGTGVPHFANGQVHVFEDQGGWSEVQILTNDANRAYDRFGDDLLFEGGSLFVSSRSSASAQRFDPATSGADPWVLAERYISASGFTWAPTFDTRVASAAGRVITTEPQGATVFAHDVPAELEVGCTGAPLANASPSIPAMPIILDVRGQFSLSEPTLPFLLAHGSAVSTGVLFYGFGPANKPFGSSTLCVTGPKVRAQLGGPTSGSFSAVELDLQSKPVTGGANSILVGQEVHFQYWCRIPGGTTHLSSSLRAVFAP